MTQSPADWLPRTGIISRTLRSVIEYGLPLPFLTKTGCQLIEVHSRESVLEMVLVCCQCGYFHVMFQGSFIPSCWLQCCKFSVVHATMPPRNIEQTSCSVDDELPETIDQPPLPPTATKRLPMQIVWRNVVWFFFLHAFALYGLYLLPFSKPPTWLWGNMWCIYLHSHTCCVYFVLCH